MPDKLPLPKLEDPKGEDFGDEAPGTKIFNARISEGTKDRLNILKKDNYLEGITWNDLFELVITNLCQTGIVSEETIRKLKQGGGWEGTLSREFKQELGVGIRWNEVGPILQRIEVEIAKTKDTLSGVEEALFEFAAAVEASEETEPVEEEKEAEPAPEGELFSTEKGE